MMRIRESKVRDVACQILISVLVLNGFVGLTSTLVEVQAQRRVIVVNADQPNLWTLEQAHYLLAQMHRRNLDLKAKSLEDLDPNEIAGLRFDVMRMLVEFGATFNQADLESNRLFSANRTFNAERRQELLTERDRLRQDSLQLADEIEALEIEKASTDDEDVKKRIDTKIAAKNTRLTKVDKEIELLNDELGTLTAASGTPMATTGGATFDRSRLPTSEFDQAFREAAAKQISKFNDSPKLNASLRLDNFLQMQYEIISKQLSLLRDELGPGERLVFLEPPTSGESRSAKRLVAAAGKENVLRQHMGKLQHNKTIVVDGKKVQAAICGSTNHSWRGFFVQNNNAIILRGKKPVKLFMDAFEHYWNNEEVGFAGTGSAQWNDMGLKGIKCEIGFSPRSEKNAVLQTIADDIANNTTSSLFFSLAFLFQTPGAMQSAIKKIKKDNKIFSYGISDHMVKGLMDDDVEGVDVQKPDGTVTHVAPQELSGKLVPEPFKSEPTGGGGTRMHHKFVVIDFDKPTARVYMGSYNFSVAADTKNGENLLLIRDRRVAVSYVVEALRLFDHYHFRVAQMDAKKAKKKLQLSKPLRKSGEKPWWHDDYTDARRIRDRELFA